MSASSVSTCPTAGSAARFADGEVWEEPRRELHRLVAFAVQRSAVASEEAVQRLFAQTELLVDEVPLSAGAQVPRADFVSAVPVRLAAEAVRAQQQQQQPQAEAAAVLDEKSLDGNESMKEGDVAEEEAGVSKKERKRRRRQALKEQQRLERVAEQASGDARGKKRRKRAGVAKAAHAEQARNIAQQLQHALMPTRAGAGVGIERVCDEVWVCERNFLNFRLSEDRLAAEVSCMESPAPRASSSLPSSSPSSSSAAAAAAAATVPGDLAGGVAGGGLQHVCRHRRRMGAERVVVDFSSPNVAKQMHVGHLRSTIIGEALCRTLEFLGDDVVRLNHVGDWGTQFGILIRWIKQQYPPQIVQLLGPTTLRDSDVSGSVPVELQSAEGCSQLYRDAQAAYETAGESGEFQSAAKREVVLLQQGDPLNTAIWQHLCAVSRLEFERTYETLQVRLTERGESFYQELLPGIIDTLRERNLLEEAENGALCVRSGADNTLCVVQKADGGYMYTTTDLAAVQHRCRDERAARVLYVVDRGQASHFEHIFSIAERAGLSTPASRLRHVSFGVVLGADGKRMRSRGSTGSPLLRDLLQEAQQRGVAAVLHHRRDSASSKVGAPALSKDATETPSGVALGSDPTPTPEEEMIGRAIGVAAVKYADLRTKRESDYRFDWNTMLSLNGNTAPYMLYAYARIRGVQRRCADDRAVSAVADNATDAGAAELTLPHDAERDLTRRLVRFPSVVDEVSRTLYPHRLCEYLFELCQQFNSFYENCPVRTAETASLRSSRERLCALTGDVLECGLNLLGIEPLETM